MRTSLALFQEKAARKDVSDERLMVIQWVMPEIDDRHPRGGATPPNTLATVDAIASQSLRNVPGAERAQYREVRRVVGTDWPRRDRQEFHSAAATPDMRWAASERLGLRT